MRLRFTKVDAAGNDFLVVNTADSTVRDWPTVARTLCDRQHGVGADGLVTVGHLGRGTFRVGCVNPDGSPSPADGNAMRGCARAVHGRYGYRTMTLLAGPAAYRAEVDGPAVAVTFPPGGPVRGPLTAGGWAVRAVRIGGEHAVLLVEEDRLADLDVHRIGAEVRHDPVFGPDGANVNVVGVLDRQRLCARSYERGVERETLSSGSGAIAAVLVARATGAVGAGPVSVRTTSGDVLDVRPVADGRVEVSGVAVEVFTGETAWTAERAARLVAG